jgi:gamma-glutamyl hydrolase
MESDSRNFHSHGWSVTPQTYLDNPKLAEFFSILALAQDNAGNVILSVVEGKNYPVYAVMFHPEKIAYEWAANLDIPHDRR